MKYDIPVSQRLDNAYEGAYDASFSEHMVNAKEQQIFELIKQSASVLMCLPESPSTDAIASGLALLAVVEKLGKRGKVVCSNFQLPANHSFLPKSEEIFDELSALQKFVISVDVRKTRVEELSYAIEGDKLNIYISPKDGYFQGTDVSTTTGDYAFDLVITVDSHDLQSLGRIYEMNTDFFYHTPIVNIDHAASNEHFGQVNMVNVTATSTSELVFELVKDWGNDILDEYIATNLLTGMISKTKSFQSGTVTPRSLAIASHLISQGARREEIVKNLYQSKDISTLKLWGRALSRLEADAEHKIVWSLLSPEDFTSAGATETALPDVIDELIINTPDARNVFILSQRPDNSIYAVISSAPFIDVRSLFAEYTPEGSEHFVQCTITGKTLTELRDEILSKLKKAHTSTE